MAALHPRLQTPQRRFVLLGAVGEDLKKPFENAWQETANYQYDDPKLAAHKGNYGVCGGYGDLHIIDSDDLPRWGELDVLPLIPATFTIESRPGHRQFYVTCKEHFQSGGLFDPEKTEINEAGRPEYIHIGDIKAGAKDGICGGQAVGPGCKHPSGSIYQVVVDAPIAEVSRERLQSIISRFKTSKKADTDYKKLEQAVTKAKQRKYVAKDPLDSLLVVDIMPPAGETSQSGDELRGDHPVHGSTNGGNYVVNTTTNLWHCFRCESGGGAALAIAVKHGIISCSDASAGVLRGDLFKQVMKVAREQGYIKNGANPKEPEKPNGPAPESPEAQDPQPCGINELLKVFRKWLYIEEDYNIIAPMCAAIANFCPGDPDIVGIIGPSGSTKTELIRSLGETQNQFVYPVSSITEHTLVSGHKDSNDLVPKLKGRLLTIKDLTSILSRREDVRAGIFADLREFIDGYIRKEFGNGISKEYRDIHSSVLFASTNAIERYYSMYSSLGQRMIFLRPKNDSQKARERAIQNRGRQKEMRDEIHSTATRFISSTKAMIDDNGLPVTPDEIQEEMGQFYDFLAIARTTIHHDYRTGEIDEIPEPEFPTRIANTVSRLCEVHALLFNRKEVGLKDTKLGCRIILDNVPTTRWQLLDVMSTEWMTTAMIAKRADLSSGTVRYALDELVTLKLVERLTREEKDETQDRRSDSFRLSSRWSTIIGKLKTRIRTDGIINELSFEIIKSLFKFINIQNTIITNSCLQLNGEEDGNGIEAALQRAAEEARTKEEHFRTPEPKPDLTGMSIKEIIAAGLKYGLEEAEKKPEYKEPITCAVCGADLTGHGQITKGEKVYCAKPGCGYPAREKGKAPA
jgi:hypothetical protein